MPPNPLKHAGFIAISKCVAKKEETYEENF